MALRPMTEGGKWVRPPHDAPPVYVPPKQLDGHWKRLITDSWIPIDDPRHEEDQQVTEPMLNTTEIALQAKVDQLEAMVKQLLAQQSSAAPTETETEKRKRIELMQAQAAREAAETNDAARAAFGVPAKNTRSR